MEQSNPFELFFDYMMLTRTIQRRMKEGKPVDKFIIEAHKDLKQQVCKQYKITKPN